jgi:hypothetical protein
VRCCRRAGSQRACSRYEAISGGQFRGAMTGREWRGGTIELSVIRGTGERTIQVMLGENGQPGAEK